MRKRVRGQKYVVASLAPYDHLQPSGIAGIALGQIFNPTAYVTERDLQKIIALVGSEKTSHRFYEAVYIGLVGASGHEYKALRRLRISPTDQFELMPVETPGIEDVMRF